MHAQRLMWIAWPAFLVAALMEMVVFALVDPMTLFGQEGQWSRLAVYTCSFFFFWVVAMMSGLLTQWLARSPQEVNGAESENAQGHAGSMPGHGCC